MKPILYYLLSLTLLFSCAENDGNFYDTSKLPDLTPITTANYSVTFQSNWNATNFPTDFPLNATFGKTILITHNNKGTLFNPEATALPVFTDFIVNNNFSPLESELNLQQTALNTNWFDLGVLSNAAINPAFNFSISSAKPLVSLCMKINPSPNWFIGISNFSLLQNDGEWIDSTIVSVIAYDTDGFTTPDTTYNSLYVPNLNGLITRITPTVLTPILAGTVIGTLTFNKL